MKCELELSWIHKNKVFLENAGIDPTNSRMLSEHSTILANSPASKICTRSNQECPVLSGYAVGGLVSLRASTCRVSVHLKNGVP